MRLWKAIAPVLAFAVTFASAQFSTASAAPAFDHSYAAWNAVLVKHVRVAADGNSSRVDYAGLLADHAALKVSLKAFSAVPEAEFRRWSRAERLAFLINAYNAWTLELILSKYPDLQSIKDLGGLFQSPWKKSFIPLLGQERSLDDIEHGMIRAPGVFDEPRIHVAVVCASIGCPMLRAEAFVPARLDAQLEDSMRRFLADTSRNRFEAASGRLMLSKIFDWYGKDFAQGHQGFTSLQTLAARYAEQLTSSPEARERLRNGQFKIDYLDYDWQLNDVSRRAAR